MTNFKKLILSALAFTMILGSASTAMAANLGDGQWCNENGKYWFKLDYEGTKFIANTWHWIKDQDGIIRCYYFDKDGWLVTNKIVDGNQLNQDGRWVKDGMIQTSSADNKDFYTHADLAAKKKTTTALKSVSTTASTLKVNSKSVLKVSSNGLPKSTTLNYKNSDLNGRIATNTWANFTINFESVTGALVSDRDSGDFTINSTDTSKFSMYYLPLGNFVNGNTSLDSFIKSYIADKRNGGQTLVDDVTFGPYTFKHATKNRPNPRFTRTDSVYFRLVEGTNMVQVISVEMHGEEDFTKALKTMQKAK